MPEIESEELPSNNGNGAVQNQIAATKKINIFAPTGDHKKNIIKSGTVPPPETTEKSVSNTK